jgi:hypothetical protein
MNTILVVANETIGGAKLMETIRDKAAGGKARVVVCVPRKQPRHGNVIYDDAVFDAAQVRIDLVRTVLRGEGIEAIGDVGDPDPYTATMDAIAEHEPDEIVISTLPATSSGWQRRDLVDRVSASVRGVPVTHVEVDLDREGLPFHITLVVANRTASGSDLMDHLKARTSDKPQVFIVVVPQEGGEGIHVKQARARLAQVLDNARAAGLVAAGLIGDPDPYTATMNAVDLFRIDDVVISTLPATRSGWLRADLIARVRNASNKPVDHVETAATAPATA